MRPRFPLLLLVAAVAVGVGGEPAKTGSKSSAKDKPLLLLDDSAETKPPAGGADNSRCQVCHLNLVQEELALKHAKAGVGCAKCHGACDAHIADESWGSGGNGTAPDIMYRKPKINPFCMTCHEKTKLTNDAHKELLADPKGKQTCTDCHGKHRLVQRKCKWK